jgi:hypothetical protein
MGIVNNKELGMNQRNLNQAMDLLWDLWHELPNDHPDFDELDSSFEAAWNNLQHVNNTLDWNGNG